MSDWSAQLLRRNALRRAAKISAVFIGSILAFRRFRQGLGKVIASFGLLLELRRVLHAIVRPTGATRQQTHENQSEHGFHSFSLLYLRSEERRVGKECRTGCRKSE